MLLSYSSSRTVRSCQAWVSKATFSQRFLNETASRTRTDPPAPAEKLLACPQSEEAGGRLPGTGLPKPDPPAPPSPPPAKPRSRPPPLTVRPPPAGRSSGRAESSENPLRAQYLLENIIMAGCMGPGGDGGVGNAALCPPRPAAAPFIRPRGD